MEQVLDNPVWHALNTGNKALAIGDNEAKCFDEEVALFAGIAQNTDHHFRRLSELTPANGIRRVVSTTEMTIPPFWKLRMVIPCFQLVYNGEAPPVDEPASIIPLTDEHTQQVLALTKLTNPGPFEPRTMELGHYRGIFDGDDLVAMAGQRMHPIPYAEISAVCTHPDHLGKGHARRLLLDQIHRIQATDGIPFLHVRDDNHRAISVYEHIGFVKRKRIWVHVLQDQG